MLVTVDVRVRLAGQRGAVLLEKKGVFLPADLRVELGVPSSCKGARERFGGRRGGRRAGLTTSLRNNLNRADLRVLDLRSEGDLGLAVGHFDGDRPHVGFQGPACLDPHVEIFKFLPLDVEGKHALSRSGDAVEGFRKVQFHQVFPVGYRP